MIYDPIFGFTFVAQRGGEYEKAEAGFAKSMGVVNYNPDPAVKNRRGQFCNFAQFPRDCLLWFHRNADHATVAHEAFHAARYVAGVLGIAKAKDNLGGEWTPYYIEWLTREIADRLW